jgi:hypothetical protein
MNGAIFLTPRRGRARGAVHDALTNSMKGECMPQTGYVLIDVVIVLFVLYLIYLLVRAFIAKM